MYGTSTQGNSKQPSQSADQLHRDRLTAVIVMVVMVALTGLLIWLASWAGDSSHSIETYWPLMP